MKNKYIDIHSHKKNTNPYVLQILNDDTFLFDHFSFDQNSLYCSGFHPYLFEKKINPSTVLKHINKISLKQIVGIGEIGLDRSLATDFTLQERIFVDFLLLAKEKTLPVFIHCVRAYSDLISLLKKVKFQQPIILHDFRGNSVELGQLLKSDFDFSYSLSPAFLTKKDNLPIFQKIPKEKMFLESDDSKIKITKVYENFCNHFQMNHDQLRYQHVQNFNRLFPHISF